MIVPNILAAGCMGTVVALVTLTASHRDLDLDVLEQLSSGAHSVGSAVLEASPRITGCVVLATCNRFELYLETDGDESTTPLAAAAEAVAACSGLPSSHVEGSLQVRHGAEVARHLFSVASGLESMVVGEREVAGQVRRALAVARSQGTTSPTLERLFQTASRTSRAVGSRTGLGGTGRSVVGVALDLAAQELGRHGVDLSTSRVLLVGTGSYAGACVTALRARGCQDIAVHSPSGRAADFAADRGLVAVAPQGFADRLARTDVVVSCSGAIGPVIDAAMVATARARSAGGDGRPLPVVLVDLALRHDIDPEVGDLPGVLLIDLAAVQRHAPSAVTPAVEAGRRIVARRAADFEAGISEQALAPAVVALRSYVQDALVAEVARARAAVLARGGDEAEVARVERSLRRFAAALLHTPAVRARDHARLGRHDEYRAGLHALFGLEIPPAPAGPPAPAVPPAGPPAVPPAPS